MNTLGKMSRITFVVLGLVFAALLMRMGYVDSYDTTTINGQVNVTGGPASVSAVVINGGLSVNLSEGTIHTVTCNATVIDYMGLNDIDKVNATFFRTNYSLDGDQDNNSRYHNYNCSYNYSIDANTFVYLCDFPNVTYYAYNGTWNCTATANSSINYPQSASGTITVLPLFAINVTDVVNFGNLAVLDTSAGQGVNVTNFGNMPLNLTVYGYGGTSNATGGGKAFHCPSGSNITVDNLRWTTMSGGVAWSSMINLTSGPRTMDNITISRQSTGQVTYNTTYWKLYVPPNPYGLCNGTIVYEATAGGSN